jgi:hypothetical protein
LFLSKVSSNLTDDELKFDEIDAEGRRADGSLVFTSTTEFTTRLQARLNETARSKTEAAVRAAATERHNAVHSRQMNGVNNNQASSKWTDLSADGTELVNNNPDHMNVVDVGDDDDDENGSGADESNLEESGQSDNHLDFVHNQPLAAQSMAATLALLKSKGELKPKDELAGRTKDARNIDPSSQDFGVKLEYRDNFGRKLTQKEAFRQLSYRFHGYGPGKKKKEKRLKAMEVQNKAQSSRGTLDGGLTMKSLVKTQEATGKAHVIVQVRYLISSS